MNKLDQESAALRRLTEGVAESDVRLLIRRGTRAILLLLWVFSLVTAGVSGWLLTEHAKTHTETTAVSLEQFARRTITLAAFAVSQYETYLATRGAMSGIAEDPAATSRFAELVKWLPPGSGGGVALPDGTLAISTIPQPAQHLNVSDRRWFAAPAHEGAQGYVGPAVIGRLDGKFYFTYSTAYRGADGGLLAVINLGVPSASITGLAEDQHHTSLVLVQSEGNIVAAQPFSPDLVGQTATLPVPAGTSATQQGRMFGSYAIYSIRYIPDLKLYAVVSVPVLGVLQPLFWGVGIGLPVLLLLTRLLLVLSAQLQEKSQQVEQALADNRVLFQEVHHRVKNNLQVISSLLRLQTERLPPELRPMLGEAGARVRAIALVHEQIYRTSSPSDVQLDEFLAQLVHQLSASMISSDAAITTHLQAVTISLDRAVPVAILATEAITNAIKHGLADGDGVITVSLASKDGRIVITVEDSGASVASTGEAGLGTRIMTALSRQIEGEWNLADTPTGGTRFTLSWPASE